ncbi:MAG TPA: alpha/beta fold hydrolase [Gemmatimonadaceae bacterium]|nr:alpha/beta fold hydrolase [Gemmatimonadaceae bacterium]
MPIRFSALVRVVSRALVATVAVVAMWWFLGGGFPRAASDRSACASPVTEEWVRGGSECLHVQTYRSARIGPRPDLVVVLHGDAPFEAPGYQYAAARIISQQSEDVIAVGLLRPGYTDDGGHRSSGRRGHAMGDNYTPAIVDAIAAAIDTLRAAYHPAHVLLVGHSGGAAIAANILGRHPSTADGAVLVSCPCDVPTWRRHMVAVQHQPLWLIPVRSLSPASVAGSVEPKTTVTLVVGTADNLAPPPLSRAYAADLRARGVRVNLVELAGAPHNILLDSGVLRQIILTLATIRGSNPS